MALKVTAEGTLGEAIELEVDSAIKEFDAYFSSLQPDNHEIRLTGYERAAIKTFVAYMLGIRPGRAPRKE